MIARGEIVDLKTIAGLALLAITRRGRGAVRYLTRRARGAQPGGWATGSGSIAWTVTSAVP